MLTARPHKLEKVEHPEAPPATCAKQDAASHSRPEIVLAGLLYLMSAHAQRPSQQLAVCVTCHLQCLADHPALDPVLRHMCAKLEDEWRAYNEEQSKGKADVCH